MLNGHSIAEEAAVYPALAEEGQAMANTAYAEQATAKMKMAALERTDPMSQDYLDQLEQLKTAVLHHAYREESDWFLDLRETASPDVQATVTKRFREEFDRYISGDAESDEGSRATKERFFTLPD